ncbi:hypothetical protein NHX12_030186 [Muraenolepis orangiensis]|uniref:Uncharacterized protein n=1 Tax=Muraenolepis orangiensis TaxID=630683 RepID=A0A9Q0EAS6_9TELE|nr:hypothetical protein NHX12_030186 [Muraenolepis orangiensis]
MIAVLACEGTAVASVKINASRAPSGASVGTWRQFLPVGNVRTPLMDRCSEPLNREAAVAWILAPGGKQ